MSPSYTTTLEFLSGLHRHGVKLGLDSTRELLSRLGNPHHRYPAIHIAGTNGKGSVAAMTAAMLQAGGYRVGLYTSPHLQDFRERIQVNREPVAQGSVVEQTERLRRHIKEHAPPTFFEFTTALAFQHFADEAVDIAVVEVGMGGRFDATNVIHPVASLITNVALDHQAYLGPTPEKIAREKAGIIKRGIPTVLGRMREEPAAVIESVAAAVGAPLYRWGRNFMAEGDPVLAVRYTGLHTDYDRLTVGLDGAHQVENAASALAVLEASAPYGIRVPEPAVRQGLATVSWEVRLEILERDPLILLDGAHNPAAAEMLARHLAVLMHAHPKGRLILVVGMMHDKDHRGFLGPFRPLVDALILTQAQLSRAAPPSTLAEAVRSWNTRPYVTPSAGESVTLARRLARKSDIICITGSLILLGEIKSLLGGRLLSPLRG